MAKERNRAHWHKWAVVIPAIGVAVTGAALWYNNIFGSNDDIGNEVEINQSASGSAVNMTHITDSVLRHGDFPPRSLQRPLPPRPKIEAHSTQWRAM